ncbi:hypothetical protein Tco_0374339 [Tanacetum coccineum]
MANIRTCNKHNMIACVEKTEHNADFHQIVDYLTGCSINYSLLVDPDLIGPWLQQFWATASLRLVSWQCKKQTIVAISSTEAEYVAAASCCAQVLWMQNQLLDYGFNFMNTEIHIDNESTICIVKNPVLHSKTKHIQIRHHFIRDCYEQRLINVVKVHTDDNVADLLTKGFDLARFNFLVVTIGMMNP